MKWLLLLPALILAAALAGTASAQPSFSAGLQYSQPTGGALDHRWQQGAALEFGFPVGGAPDRYLTLDLGYQFFSPRRELTDKHAHGLRGLLTGHLRPAVLGRPDLFLGLGYQNFIVENGRELPLVQEKADPSTIYRVGGRGFTATVGTYWPLLRGRTSRLSLLGSWNPVLIEGEFDSYLLLGLVLTTGHNPD